MCLWTKKNFFLTIILVKLAKEPARMNRARQRRFCATGNFTNGVAVIKEENVMIKMNSLMLTGMTTMMMKTSNQSA